MLRQVPRRVRRIRRLRPSRGGQSGVSRTLCAAAPRPGERRHLLHRRQRNLLHKPMGHVADIFTPEVLAGLPGDMAIGHTRYSTAGDTVLTNAQPFSVACNKGHIAVAHNGNITNAARASQRARRPRLHLPGHQRHRSHPALGRPLQRAHRRRRLARSAAAARRRLFAGLPRSGPHHRRARSARLPSAGHGPDGTVRRQRTTSSPRRPAPST